MFLLRELLSVETSHKCPFFPAPSKTNVWNNIFASIIKMRTTGNWSMLSINILYNCSPYVPQKWFKRHEFRGLVRRSEFQQELSDYHKKMCLINSEWKRLLDVLQILKWFEIWHMWLAGFCESHCHNIFDVWSLLLKILKIQFLWIKVCLERSKWPETLLLLYYSNKAL